MEKNEISIHEVRVYEALLKNKERWITSKQLAEIASVAARTSRAMALKLVRLGLLDQAEVFPAHHYRLSELANRRNVAYLQRIERAREVFANTLNSPAR